MDIKLRTIGQDIDMKEEELTEYIPNNKNIIFVHLYDFIFFFIFKFILKKNLIIFLI